MEEESGAKPKTVRKERAVPRDKRLTTNSKPHRSGAGFTDEVSIRMRKKKLMRVQSLTRRTKTDYFGCSRTGAAQALFASDHPESARTRIEGILKERVLMISLRRAGHWRFAQLEKKSGHTARQLPAECFREALDLKGSA